MNIKNLISRQKDWEGFRADVYLCSQNVLTIGYGTTRINGVKVNQYTPSITEEAAEVYLKAGLLDAMAVCDSIYREAWRYLEPEEQQVLVHMAYQLGNRLSKFVKMNKAVRTGNRIAWAYEMKNSLWYRQTPRPAEALRKMVLKADEQNVSSW